MTREEIEVRFPFQSYGIIKLTYNGQHEANCGRNDDYERSMLKNKSSNDREMARGRHLHLCIIFIVVGLFVDKLRRSFILIKG